MRRDHDGDSSQQTPVRGRPRRQVDVSNQQIPATLSTTDVARDVPMEAHNSLPLHGASSTSYSGWSTPCVTTSLSSGEHPSQVISSVPSHLSESNPPIDEQRVCDITSARVIQTMQSHNPATPVKSVIT